MLSKLSFALVALILADAASAQRSIVVVRHAEKATESNEPAVPLSDAGRARAERLARLLSEAGVTAVYATDTVRARGTAEPLAKLAGVEIRTYAPKNARGNPAPEILVERLRKEDAGGVVLVVGHSNTVPELLRALGHEGKVEIPSSQFDDLFLVTPKSSGPPAVIRLKY